MARREVTAAGIVFSCILVDIYQHFGGMSCSHLYSCVLAQAYDLMEGMK